MALSAMVPGAEMVRSVCAVFCHVLRAGSVLALAALVAVSPACAQNGKTAEFQTSAPFAILVDASTGTVLYEKSADQATPPSSMAKLMTAAVIYRALREGQLKLTDDVTISENAWRRGGAPSGGSAMFAALGSRVSVADLIRGMVIQSGNDASIALAEALAGTEAAFAARMNALAKELGLTGSTFTNATGLPDPAMRATVRDLARLARHLIESHPEQYKLYAEREFTWNKIKQQNRNPLLAIGIGADGLKTGYTREAGYGLVGSAVQNELRLIVVVNGLKTARERADEARKLLEWGFRGFEGRLLFAQGETVGEAKLYGGERGRVSLVADREIRLMVPRGSTERLTARIVYRGPVPAPVEKGQHVATLRIWRGETVTLEVPLKAADSVGVGNAAQRALDAATELIVTLFRAGASRI